MVISIIGPDGSGKSTQARLLYERLKNEQARTLLIRPVYFLIEKIIGQEKMCLALSPRSFRISAGKKHSKITNRFKTILLPILAYPYVLLSHIYIKNVIAKNRFVVCDRYFYQVFYDLFGIHARRFHKIMPYPDLSVYLKTNFQTLRSRQNFTDRSYPSEYFLNVTCYFNEISEDEHILVCNNTSDSKKTHEDIYFAVHQYIAKSVLEEDEISKNQMPFPELAQTQIEYKDLI